MGERRRDRKQLKATKAQTKAAYTLADRQAALHQQQMTEQRRQHAAQLGAMQQAPAPPPLASQKPMAPPPPAGRWGTDPSGKWAKRWYDGTRWTEHVEDAGGQRHSDPPPSSAR